LRYFTKKPGYATVFLRFARPEKIPERRRDWLKGTGVGGAVQPAKVVGIVHAPDVTDGWESLFSSIANYYAG